jgi:hypothetical protein
MPKYTTVELILHTLGTTLSIINQRLPATSYIIKIQS